MIYPRFLNGIFHNKNVKMQNFTGKLMQKIDRSQSAGSEACGGGICS